MTKSTDVRYGRKGGRWADGSVGRVEMIARSFDRLRTNRGKEWPDATRSRVSEPEGREEWLGRARQARARADAGIDLDEIDARALGMYPDPPSSFAHAGHLGPPVPGCVGCDRRVSTP